jgi:hypothetical protein
MNIDSRIIRLEGLLKSRPRDACHDHPALVTSFPEQREYPSRCAVCSRASRQDVKLRVGSSGAGRHSLVKR